MEVDVRDDLVCDLAVVLREHAGLARVGWGREERGGTLERDVRTANRCSQMKDVGIG